MRIRRYVLLLIGAVVAALVGGQAGEDDPRTTTFSVISGNVNTTTDLSGPSNATAGETNAFTTPEESCKSPFSPEMLLENGLINGTHLTLLVALPLSFEGAPVLSPGFFQLAAALMAIDHFNERNNAIVPEMDLIKKDCPIQMDYESLVVMDTGTIQNNAMTTIIGILGDKRPIPHAIIGPYNDIPATELSVLASAIGIPMVAHRALDHNLLKEKRHPMVTQVNPDLYAEVDFLGDYLNHTGRTDYIAILYASSTDSTLQRLEAFHGVANKLGMKNVRAFGYASPLLPQIVESRAVQTIEEAVEKLAESGYRTIVWMTADLESDLERIGSAANKHGLDTGNHMWIMGANIDLDRPLSQKDVFNPPDGQKDVQSMLSLLKKATSNNELAGINFMYNSAFLRQAELMDKGSWNDSVFMEAWFQLNSSFFDRVQAINPIPKEEYQKEWEHVVSFSRLMGWLDPHDFPSLTFPPDDLFINPRTFMTAPSNGAVNLYDAIMAVGLGACKAASIAPEIEHQNITGEMFQTAIRSIKFQGSSGEVRFGEGFPGSRAGKSVTYAVFNMFPERNFSTPFRIAEYRNATDGKWHTVEPFIYADGSTSPPELLRNPNDQYLDDGLTIVGLTLAGVAYFCILASLIWIAVYRHHRIVVASQPFFLVCMCMGLAIETSAIPLISFDESHGCSVDTLSALCIAIPWVVAAGHIIAYNCLFTKLWRVNRVLQFSRRKVAIKHVMWPALLLEGVAFTVLSIWTATTDYGWQRSIVDETTGETMGQCGDIGEQMGFWIPITILALIPTVLTGIMAWKTIDVDANYSEAKWIFALILVQCQVVIVAAPLIFILEDVSTDGRYLGTVLVLWTFPMTNIGLIMTPKMVALHFPGGHRDTRGSSGGVRVTGVRSQASQPRTHVERCSLDDAQKHASVVSAASVTPH